MDQEYAKYLVQKTIADYNRIAPLWSTKRRKVPNDILELKKYILPNENILDLGCGSGFLYEVTKEAGANYLGVDASENQVLQCRKRYPEANFLVVPPFSLPFPDETFDKIFCLSTIHHIPSEELRLKFLNEAKRILKKDSALVISAWYLKGKSIEIMDDKNTNKALDENDLIIPFKDEKGTIKAERYIHSFVREEMAQLLKKAAFQNINISIVNRGVSSQNILGTAKK